LTNIQPDITTAVHHALQQQGNAVVWQTDSTSLDWNNFSFFNMHITSAAASYDKPEQAWQAQPRPLNQVFTLYSMHMSLHTLK
jgi:hypothetical protein